jgi:hypothetical protein
MESTSATTWVLLGSGAVCFALVYTSAWLHGTAWFVAILASLAVFVTLLCASALANESGLRLWAGLLGAAILYGGFFFVIASRYITRTRAMDLTYQSHGALVQYISNNRLDTPLARLLRVLGPILMAAMVVLTVVAVAYEFGLTGDL